eukprot:TRINITY_DN74539_c0_g1_i1.p1 TRINITY_DN74539_c0_g1~~TRINITY_DN74539_c0_g1_i1.p1  ORF type:complete len:436 (+),score=60.03 TRINITY_DN74539_c0_g1_i1:49-1356(+)
MCHVRYLNTGLVVRRWTGRLLFLTVATLIESSSGVFFVINHGATDLVLPTGVVVPGLGGFLEERTQPTGTFVVKLRLPSTAVDTEGVPENHEQFVLNLAAGTAGRHVGVVVPPSDKQQHPVVHSVDANDLQIAISDAAGACGGSARRDFRCIGEQTMGGISSTFAEQLFTDLWPSWEFWELCAQAPASQPLRENETSQGKVGGQVLEILRADPLVAAIRGFASEEECTDLVSRTGLEGLSEAHVGGAGKTSPTMSRETLTANLFVDWNIEDTLSRLSVRTFDVASELLDVQVPYEGQEPLNFLYYLRGYEYRPHTDGGSLPRQHMHTGKRVATTLVYCEVAEAGGATVFTAEKQLKFQPRRGDLLFFSYAPAPRNQAEHAACPVSKGTKKTLTQWHRLAVSVEKPWDNFEPWGKFHNPHGSSRWKGPRYGSGSEL